MNKKENAKAFIFIIPSLSGFAIFFIIPFFYSLKYAAYDNVINGTFSGFDNFRRLFSSEAFILAAKNTLIFMALGIPLNIIISLIIGCMLGRLTNSKALSAVFMSPLVIPSACTAFFFRSLFASNGLVSMALKTDTNWLQTDMSMPITVLIYIWKNMGYNLVLIMAGLANIPKEYREWAGVEGIGGIRFFFTITLRYLIPSLFIVFVMSCINSFKVFREIYMLSGSRPHQSIYMLQHYMNNQFSLFNYQNLTAASFSITLVITAAVVTFFMIDRKLTV